MEIEYTIPRFADERGQQQYFLPISCIPGSTFVFSLLTKHPKIHNAIRKEPSWFVDDRNFMDRSEKQFMYFADYLVNFQPLTKANPALLVDGTVGMALYWPNLVKKQRRIVNFCLFPSVVPHVLPRARFIVVMRDPLSMLYSTFWFLTTMLRQQVPSRDAQLKAPTQFHNIVVDKITAINSCKEVFPLVKCLLDSHNTNQHVIIYESVYYIHIQKWLSVVPRERFLFLTLEELSTNLHVYRTANNIWNFLGVSSLNNIMETVKKHVDKNEQKVIDYEHDPNLVMRNDTKELLRNFLHPYNRMLAELLGDRKFLWEN